MGTMLFQVGQSGGGELHSRMVTIKWKIYPTLVNPCAALQQKSSCKHHHSTGQETDSETSFWACQLECGSNIQSDLKGFGPNEKVCALDSSSANRSREAEEGGPLLMWSN